MKFELIDNQARIGRGEETLNDKFQCLFIPRAKKSIITGAGPLRGQNEDPAKVDKINTNVGKATTNYTTMLEPGSIREAVKDTPGKDNNFQFMNTLLQGPVVAGGAGQVCEDVQGGQAGRLNKVKINTNVGKATINYTTMLEPGSSREAGKDTPGKDNNFQFMNTLLQGPVVAEGAGQVCEDVQGGTHGECEVCGEVPDGEVRDQTGQATHPGPGGEVHDGEQGGCQVGHHQQHGDGGGVQVQRDEVQDGGAGQHVGPRGAGAVSRVANSLTFKLNSPKDSDFPGWVKSRRKRVPDGLVQRRIQYFSKDNANCSSESFVPSGGSLKVKNVRGIKRGMGDQVEGPSGLPKKIRKD